MKVDDATKAAYLEAWADWHRQVEHLHRVFFEGEAIRPEQLKGLLNREARKKETYDLVRRRLLGIDGSDIPARDPNQNPFKSTP